MFDQFDNHSKATLIRNGERRMDAKPELRQADNVGNIQILESAVVGDVEEDGVAAFRSILPTERDRLVWAGVLVILCTAFTRSELSPRISPIKLAVCFTQATTGGLDSAYGAGRRQERPPHSRLFVLVLLTESCRSRRRNDAVGAQIARKVAIDLIVVNNHVQE